MPKFRGVDVRVVAEHDEPLPEYGLTFRQKHKECSCYIESTTELSFKIRLDPERPFGHRELFASVYDFDTRKYSFKKHHLANDYPLRNREPLSELDPKPLAPPFHFLASVYLDGRKKPERRSVIYLDPDHKLYKHDPTDMSSRWVKHDDGNIKAHKWVFKDVVGIETMLDKMMIKGFIPIQGNLNKDQADLVSALGASTLEAGKEDEDVHDSAIGCIKVTLQRVLVGQIAGDRCYEPTHSTSDKEDVDMDTHSSHVAKVAEDGENVKFTHKDPIKVIEYVPYKEHEELYATFKFLYRSRDVLKKFDFPEMAMEKKAKMRIGGNRDFSNLMANTTPLSISNSPTYKASLKKKDDQTLTKTLSSLVRDSITPAKATEPATTNGERNAKPKIVIKSPPTLSISTRSPPDSLGSAMMDDDGLVGGVTVSGTEPETESDSEPEQKVRMATSNDQDLFRDEGQVQSSENSVDSAESPERQEYHAFQFVASSDADADDEGDDGNTGTDVKRQLKPSPFANVSKKTLKRPRVLDEDYEDPLMEFPSGLAGDKDDGGLGVALERFSMEHKKIRSSSATISLGKDTSPHFAKVPTSDETKRTKAPRPAYKFARKLEYGEGKEQESPRLVYTRETGILAQPSKLTPAKHPRLASASSSGTRSAPPRGFKSDMLHTRPGSFSDASGYFGDGEEGGENSPQKGLSKTNENKTPSGLAQSLTSEASSTMEDETTMEDEA